MITFSKLNKLLNLANIWETLLKYVLLYDVMTAFMIVPLVSYIRNSLRFWYYASLNTCSQNLEKNWGHWENLGESLRQTFKGSDQEKCQFWYFGNFQHQTFAGFW